MPDCRLRFAPVSFRRKRAARKRGRDRGSLHGPSSLDYDGSSTVGLEHVAGDDHLHHLARAFGDAVAALLPPHLLDRKIGGERDATVDLHALVGGFERHFVGVIFGHVGVLARLFALIEARRGLIDEEPRGLQFDEHVGQHPLHRLPVGERLAEGRTLLGIGSRHFDASLGDAERTRTVLDAADIEPLLAVAHAFAFRADAVARRHAHIVEHDLPRLVAHHGFIAGPELHTRRIHIHDEAGNAAARALCVVGRDHELHEIGVTGSCDEALDAADKVVIAVAHGDGAHAAGIGAGVGLGLREAGLLLSAQQRQQVLLLHLALEGVENAACGRTGNALAARRYGDGARELFPYHGAREDRHAAAAIFRRHVELPDAELPGAALEALEIFRLDLFAVGSLPLDRDQLVVDEAPQRGFEDSQLFRQFEIHCLYAPSASSRHNTRTSTATTLVSAPAGFGALDRRSRAGLLALTISGLISMSFIFARRSRKKRPSASAAASSAARSAAGCPRKPDRRRANFRPSTIVLTSWAVTGSRRNAASAASSTARRPSRRVAAVRRAGRRARRRWPRCPTPSPARGSRRCARRAARPAPKRRAPRPPLAPRRDFAGRAPRRRPRSCAECRASESSARPGSRCARPRPPLRQHLRRRDFWAARCRSARASPRALPAKGRWAGPSAAWAARGLGARRETTSRRARGWSVRCPAGRGIRRLPARRGDRRPPAGSRGRSPPPACRSWSRAAAAERRHPTSRPCAAWARPRQPYRYWDRGRRSRRFWRRLPASRECRRRAGFSARSPPASSAGAPLWSRR